MPSAMSLTKVLYRDLLSAARQFDRDAALRALISTNMMQRPIVPGSTARVPHLEALNRCLLTFLERRSFYMPSPERQPLAELVREKFRTPEGQHSNGEGVDLAFAALKSLSDKLAEAQEYGMVGAGSARAESKTATKKSARSDDDVGVESLTPLDVQLADNVASGVFLLSHPLLSGMFRRSVIVLTEHGQKGSRGYIVNHPTSKPVMSAFKVHPRIMHAFGSSKVRIGGPVRTEHAEILHGRPDFGGERVVTSNLPKTNQDKLFVGVDLETAARAVDEQEAQQSDVVFFNGVSTWTVGQLETELQRGTWVAVKAPVSLALNAKKELWEELMGALGGEYQEFSRMPIIYDEDFDDDDLNNE